MAHKPTDRKTAIERMRASAEQRGGMPDYAGLARELGIANTNLRRWWKEEVGHKRPASPPAAPDVAAQPKPKRKPRPAKTEPKGELIVIQSPKQPAARPTEPQRAPTDHPSGRLQTPDPLATTESVFFAWMFQEALEDLRQAKEDEAAAYVIAQMRPHLVNYYEKARAAAEVERRTGRGQLSPEERQERVRQLARSMSPSDAVLVVEELRARKIVG